MSTWAAPATGKLTQSGGTNTISNTLYLNSGSGSNGTYSLSGFGLLSAQSELVGYSGTGNFTQSGGTNAISGTLYLGDGSQNTGTYNLSGSGRVSAPIEYIGYWGTGNFTQSGGTNAVSGTLYLGASGSGSYSLSGSGLLSAGNEYVAYFGTGNFTQSGGTNISGGLELGYNGRGTYNLNGGTLILPTLSTGSGTAAFNFGGGTLQASGPLTTTLPMTLTGSGGNATIDTAGYIVTLSGSLSGPSGLTKTDSGTLVLSASNTYTGGTMVSGGILQFNGNTTVPSGSGNVSISNGAAVALAPAGAYSTVAGWLNSGKIASASAGALALIANDSETINMGSYTVLSLGASGNDTYSGILTPSGTTYHLGGGGGTLTFTPAITGARSLNVSGPGTVVLTNIANTYTGGTTVSAGTLQLNNPMAAKSSTVTVNADNGLAFGPGVTAPTVGGLAGSGMVNLATTDAPPLPVTLTSGGNNANTTYSGTLSGSGGVTKVAAAR